MFNFFSMANNYEERKVKRFERGELIVDTCAVNDSDQPFETGISHPKYNEGSWVIVEMYNTKTEAELGHDKWVKTMISEKLPDSLRDVSTSEMAKFCDMFAPEDKDWRLKD